MKISFLHTSISHIERFDKIINALDESIHVQHYIEEGLLEIAQKKGQVDEGAFRKAINQIQSDGSDLIICTCSTYGALCDALETIHRIDKPIGEYIIEHYSKIGIAYTLNSTKTISRQLLENIATSHHKSIQITEIDCSACWKWFETGDSERYALEIAHCIKHASLDVDIVLLAQASMKEAKKYFLNEKYKLVSSPEFGVRKYLEMLKTDV